MAIRIHFVFQCFGAPMHRGKGNTASTPPICIAVCLPFVLQYSSHLYHRKVLLVVFTEMFPTLQKDKTLRVWYRTIRAAWLRIADSEPLTDSRLSQSWIGCQESFRHSCSQCMGFLAFGLAYMSFHFGLAYMSVYQCGQGVCWAPLKALPSQQSALLGLFCSFARLVDLFQGLQKHLENPDNAKKKANFLWESHPLFLEPHLWHHCCQKLSEHICYLRRWCSLLFVASINWRN